MHEKAVAAYFKLSQDLPGMTELAFQLSESTIWSYNDTSDNNLPKLILHYCMISVGLLCRQVAKHKIISASYIRLQSLPLCTICYNAMYLINWRSGLVRRWLYNRIPHGSDAFIIACSCTYATILLLFYGTYIMSLSIQLFRYVSVQGSAVSGLQERNRTY
jgi:hypothetical protein